MDQKELKILAMDWLRKAVVALDQVELAQREAGLWEVNFKELRADKATLEGDLPGGTVELMQEWIDRIERCAKGL